MRWIKKALDCHKITTPKLLINWSHKNECHVLLYIDNQCFTFSFWGKALCGLRQDFHFVLPWTPECAVKSVTDVWCSCENRQLIWNKYSLPLSARDRKDCLLAGNTISSFELGGDMWSSTHILINLYYIHTMQTRPYANRITPPCSTGAHYAHCTGSSHDNIKVGVHFLSDCVACSLKLHMLPLHACKLFLASAFHIE